MKEEKKLCKCCGDLYEEEGCLGYCYNCYSAYCEGEQQKAKEIFKDIDKFFDGWCITKLEMLEYNNMKKKHLDATDYDGKRICDGAWI